MSQAGEATYVLGIDPGLNTTGYGLVAVVPGGPPRLHEGGVIRTQRKASLEIRLAELYDGLTEILTQYRPTALALEQLFSHYDRPRTAILMGHARGVICLAAQQAGIPISHYLPTRIKKMLTGNGSAGKPQMQLAVQRELRLNAIPQPHDVADALAIALCHCYALPQQAFGRRRA